MVNPSSNCLTPAKGSDLRRADLLAAPAAPPLSYPDQVATSSSTDNELLRRIHTFWAWFGANAQVLSGIALDANGAIAKEDMFDIVALGRACSLVHDNISVEIEQTEQEERLLVVSANGIIRLFPIVDLMVDSAPYIPGWRIVKYRQRQRPIQPLSLQGCTVHPEELQFGVLHHKVTREFGVCVFMPRYEAKTQEACQHIGFVFLDLALGEFDVATKIRTVEFDKIKSRPEITRMSIVELPKIFDHLFAKARH